MRYKTFKIVEGKVFLYYMLLVEFKKRDYIAVWGEDGKIIDIKTFRKEKEGDYFLIKEVVIN